MRRLYSIFILCISTLMVYSQTCEDLLLEYAFWEAKYKKLGKDSISENEKKKCVAEMEKYLNYAKEAECDYPTQWANDLKRRKTALYPSTIFYQGSYIFSSANEVIKIGVKQKKTLKLISKPDWLELLDTEDAKNFEFSMEENKLPYARSGIIEVEYSKKRHQCTITQAAAPFMANVTEHIGFGQDGGTSFIFVETNDTAWSVSGGNNWLTSELTDYGARVICTANPNKKKRVSYVKVKFACGQTRSVEIGQAIGRTTLSVPQKSYSFDNYGGTNNNVVVKCNYDQWNATSDVNWIKTKKKYGGISIECTPNSVAASRTATVKIETNDAEHLVEYITVTQREAIPYLSAEKNSYYSDGYERTIYVKVNTNIPDWTAFVEKGAGWTTVTKLDNQIRIRLTRNDGTNSRTSEVKLYGKGESHTISLTQPNRGYAGRYNDYFEANGGDWRVSWFGAEVGLLTSVGVNVSAINARWRPVELSLINVNINYNFLSGATCVGWEPIVRGFLPISRDGSWAAFVGMGAHVDFIESSHFLIEFGMDRQWNNKYSSRIFFKYNGGCALGMSFDLGTWY